MPLLVPSWHWSTRPGLRQVPAGWRLFLAWCMAALASGVALDAPPGPDSLWPLKVGLALAVPQAILLGCTILQGRWSTAVGWVVATTLAVPVATAVGLATGVLSLLLSGTVGTVTPSTTDYAGVRTFGNILMVVAFGGGIVAGGLVVGTAQKLVAGGWVGAGWRRANVLAGVPGYILLLNGTFGGGPNTSSAWLSVVCCVLYAVPTGLVLALTVRAAQRLR